MNSIQFQYGRLNISPANLSNLHMTLLQVVDESIFINQTVSAN